MRFSSAIKSPSDSLSLDEATCECSYNINEPLETKASDISEPQEDAYNHTNVDSEILETAEAPQIPPPTRKTSPSPMYHNDYFQIAKSSVAGWGAFATRDLTRGDIILRETPLFVADNDNIFHEFYRLDGSAMNVALSLHSHPLIKGGTPRILAVWQTNWQVWTPSSFSFIKPLTGMQFCYYVLCGRLVSHCGPFQPCLLPC